ncbi:MAG: F0F1 ATP synthase subunit A [Clostridiales bacterium]|nr:F0F1 ATP synthase subunit A [Clostridiales bacterium]
MENKNLWLLFEIAGVDVYVNETMLSTWVVSAALVIFALVVRAKVKSFKDVPSGFQNLIELAVESMDGLVRTTVGEGMDFLSGYYFCIFAFILVSNYSGLLGLRPPTSDLATTIPLALSTFVLIHGMGISAQKGKYFKQYISPNPIFLPINLIGEVSKPVSLAFRLFGNMLGGVIIMEFVYTLLPVFLRFLIPDILHAYFDLFAGTLQAFVFTVLSLTFIQIMAAPY